uniref:Uncharacterized protein n=1 Tax=Caenorhabditis japonica TaxID=281687 RepID=A0A8R1IM65_CAEJA
MVIYWTTMVVTGNGELGFDSGEGALETATTSKEGSRRETYPLLTLLVYLVIAAVKKLVVGSRLRAAVRNLR